MGRLNREKLIFAGSALSLLLAGLYAATVEPELTSTGSHRVRITAPEQIRVVLPDPDERLDLGGRNVFASWREPTGGSSGSQKTEARSGAGQGGGQDPVDLGGLRNLYEKRTGRGQERMQAKPQPYEVPASFIGVHRPAGGKWRVILKAKLRGENRSLFAGDLWPDLKFRIVRITSGSVLLQNDEGKLFLMRDLYGRRAGQHRDHAPVEPGD